MPAGLPIETTARTRSLAAVAAAVAVAAFAIPETVRGVPWLRVLLAARAAWVVSLHELQRRGNTWLSGVWGAGR